MSVLSLSSFLLYINMNSFMKMVPCHLHTWDLCFKRLCKDLMFIMHCNTALRKELLPGFLSLEDMLQAVLIVGA